MKSGRAGAEVSFQPNGNCGSAGLDREHCAHGGAVRALDVVKDDPDDNRIVECAVSAGSDYIVTGDKDLLRMGKYDSVRIVTLDEFLVVVLAKGQR